jgi:hypothetical protein
MKQVSTYEVKVKQFNVANIEKTDNGHEREKTGKSVFDNNVTKVVIVKLKPAENNNVLIVVRLSRCSSFIGISPITNVK